MLPAQVFLFWFGFGVHVAAVRVHVAAGRIIARQQLVSVIIHVVLLESGSLWPSGKDAREWLR